MPGATTGAVRALLRLEGLVRLAASVAAYARFGAGWGLFAACVLLPDLSFLAYVAGARAGAAAYNAAHSSVGGIGLIAIGAVFAAPAFGDGRARVDGARRFRPRPRLRPQVRSGLRLHAPGPDRSDRARGLMLAPGHELSPGAAHVGHRGAAGLARAGCTDPGRGPGAFDAHDAGGGLRIVGIMS